MAPSLKRVVFLEDSEVWKLHTAYSFYGKRVTWGPWLQWPVPFF